MFDHKTDPTKIKVKIKLFPFRQQSLPSRFGVTLELVVILVTTVIVVDLLPHFFMFKIDFGFFILFRNLRVTSRGAIEVLNANSIFYPRYEIFEKYQFLTYI